MQMRRLLILILVVSIVVAVGVGCGEKEEEVDPRWDEVVEFIRAGDFNGAREKARESYDDEVELANALEFINEVEGFNNELSQQNENDSQETKLEIVSSTHEVDGDWVYVRGRVKNASKNTTINYFEVICKYLDANENVLGSDYTNSSLPLKPGEMREFEILHRYDDDYKSYKVSVGDVKVN